MASIFCNSEKFVNTTNTLKLYFTITLLLFATITIAINQKRMCFGGNIKETTFWSIGIICSLQAFYGFFQLLGWASSNHSSFTLTGSFDNPAGFAAVLSMGFPVVLILHLKTKGFKRFFTIAMLISISSAVIFSESRTGIIALAFSFTAFIRFNTYKITKFWQLHFHKLVAILTLIGLCLAGVFLYNQKKDSSNGRLLIWNVSYEMIKDKPVYGHGFGAFQAKYMDYQAAHFKNNPNSEYELLADNIKHPFNEFIKIAAEFGLMVLFTVLILVSFIINRILKLEVDKKSLALGGLLSFLVFACFSYPSQYISVWILLAFYVSILIPPYEFRIKNNYFTIFSRGTIIILCVLALYNLCQKMYAEMKWKTIAVSSLQGNTDKMLPEYERLYTQHLSQNPYFLYNYGAELNVSGNYELSIKILNECQSKFNDYDLQMLLADNYYRKGELVKATQMYKHAANMIPCRFLPIYQLFNHYRKAGQIDLAEKYANEIVNKKVKIESSTVNWIKAEAIKYLKE